jgi:dTDP-4-amino-4,6-dideoxygalactose transaminase
MTENAWRVPLFDLDFDESEEKAVLEVLRSKWLTTGPRTQEFEDKFSKYLGDRILSLAVSNCTAALHMSLLACGIGPGDEIIISGLSFVAALNVVTVTGATPVLADSKSLHDWNVSPDDISSKITPRTKAIIVVHFAGHPCDMDEIVNISEKNNLILIEDVAHAIGGKYKGRMCGTFGRISCYSFFSNKNLSVGEGGMVVTQDRELYDKVRLLRSHGMTSLTIDRHNRKSVSYDVAIPGLNYRIDEIRSALGIVQLEKLDSNNLKREGLVIKYHKQLSSTKDIVIPWNFNVKDRSSSFHIFPILLPDKVNRVAVMASLGAKGIQTSIHYPAYKAFSAYRNLFDDSLKIADEISRRVLTLPLFPTMSLDAVKYVSHELTGLLDK